MKKVLVMAGCLSCLLMFSGCQTSNINDERYTLADDISASSWRNLSRIKVNLTGILSEGALVVKISDVSLRPAQHHRWSGKLEEQLAAVLSEFLKNSDPSLSVEVDVSKFYGALDSTVEIEALFTAKQKGKTISSLVLNFNEKQPVSGYECMVVTLKKGWNKLCAEFAASVEQNSRATL